MKTCPSCTREFDPAARDARAADWGTERIVYCSARCKRAGQNRRYYKRHRESVIARVIARMRGKRG